MDTQQLKIFVDLASTLHFARTAEKHNMSPSTLSRVVQRIEQNAQLSLFTRDNRNVALTRAGEAYLAFAQETLSRWRELQSQLSDAVVQYSGSVNLYCSVTASHSLLSGLLSRVRSDYPLIEIKLHTGDQAFSLQRVSEGREDFAIAAKPDKLDSNLLFKPLARTQLRLVVPKNRCAVKQQIEAMQQAGAIEWSHLPWVLPERGFTRRRLDQWFTRRQITPNVYAQVSGHEAIVSMVSLGCGVGLVPELVVANSPAKSGIVMLPFDDLDSASGVASLTFSEFEVGVCALKRRIDEPLMQAVWSSVSMV